MLASSGQNQRHRTTPQSSPVLTAELLRVEVETPAYRSTCAPAEAETALRPKVWPHWLPFSAPVALWCPSPH